MKRKPLAIRLAVLMIALALAGGFVAHRSRQSEPAPPPPAAASPSGGFVLQQPLPFSIWAPPKDLTAMQRQQIFIMSTKSGRIAEAVDAKRVMDWSVVWPEQRPPSQADPEGLRTEPQNPDAPKK